jgi:hypothetical protein
MSDRYTIVQLHSATEVLYSSPESSGSYCDEQSFRFSGWNESFEIVPENAYQITTRHTLFTFGMSPCVILSLYHPLKGRYLAHINEKNHFFEYPSQAEDVDYAAEEEQKHQLHRHPYVSQSLPYWYFDEETVVSLLNTGQYELMNARVKQCKQYHDMHQRIKLIHVYIGGTSYLANLLDNMKEQYQIDAIFVKRIEELMKGNLSQAESDELIATYPNEMDFLIFQTGISLDTMKKGLDEVVRNIRFHSTLEPTETNDFIDTLFNEKMSICTYPIENLALNSRGQLFVPMSKSTYRRWINSHVKNIVRHHKQDLHSMSHYSFFIKGKRATLQKYKPTLKKYKRPLKKHKRTLKSKKH